MLIPIQTDGTSNGDGNPKETVPKEFTTNFVTFDSGNYSLIIKKPKKRTEHMPLPSKSVTFKDYELEILKWKKKFNKYSTKYIFPISVSFTYSRIPIEVERAYVRAYKSPQLILPSNKLWLTEEILQGNNHPSTFELPYHVRRKQFLFADVFSEERKFGYFMIAYPPQASMFDTYQEFEQAYELWFENTNQLITRKNEFESRSNMQKKQHFVEFQPKKYTVNISKFPDYKRFENLKVSNYNLLKNFIYTVSNGLRKERSDKNDDGIEEKLQKINILPKIFQKTPNYIEEYEKYGCDYISQEYQSVKQKISFLIKSIDSQTLGSKLIDRNGKVDTSKLIGTLSRLTPDLNGKDCFSFLKIIANQFITEEFSFLLRLTQNNYAFLMAGYIISKCFPSTKEFYAENVFPIIRDLSCDPIIIHSINVMAQNNIIEIFNEFFLKEYPDHAKHIKMLDEFYNGYTVQVTGLFKMFKLNITDFVHNNITLEKMKYIVPIYNVLLACDHEIAFQFLESIPNFFNDLNRISILSQSDYFKIIMPFIKVKDNLVLLFRILMKDLNEPSYETIGNLSLLSIKTIQWVFIMNIKNYPQIPSNFLPILVNSLLAYGTPNSSYAVHSICCYLQSKIFTSKEDPQILNNVLQDLLIYLRDPSPNPYIINSFGKLLYLKDAKDFMKNNVNCISYLLALMRSQDTEIQQSAWRAFLFATGEHTKEIVNCLKSDSALNNEFTFTITTLNARGIVELLLLISSIFDRRKRRKSSPTTFHISDETIELCKQIALSGFQIDEYITRLNIQTKYDNIYYKKRILSKFIKLYRDSLTMQNVFPLKYN